MTIDSLKNKLKLIEEEGTKGYITDARREILRKWWKYWKYRLKKMESAPKIEKPTLGV